MRYLTKEWYKLCQSTGLHFGMRVHSGAEVYDEDLYLKLYKRKEKEFIKMRREVYDVDPRFMLEQDGCMLLPLDKFVSGEEVKEEDKIVYHMSPEERERIEKQIEKYDARPPFDEKESKEEFRYMQERLKSTEAEKLPPKLFQQIADIRLFYLGYCTREVLKQLKRLSKENEKKVKDILSEYSKVQKAEDIPQKIKDSFGFHDCQVTELEVNKNIVMRLDTQGGFTSFNQIIFTMAEIIKQEEDIENSIWLYDELYRTENGYEAHMLFAAGEENPELIIRCNDITVQ